MGDAVKSPLKRGVKNLPALRGTYSPSYMMPVFGHFVIVQLIAILPFLVSFNSIQLTLPGLSNTITLGSLRKAEQKNVHAKTLRSKDAKKIRLFEVLWGRG